MLIFFSVLPLLRDSVGILMQRTPRELDSVLGGAYERVGHMPLFVWKGCYKSSCNVCLDLDLQSGPSCSKLC